ncbi:kelch repeat-containing protein [Myxococcota bacterium]|nr:kelch repeat-containing protein [Myxococcota bacterium]
MLFLSLLTACGLQGPTPIAVLPASVNPNTLSAALVLGDELVVLGEGAAAQLNLVTGASTTSAPPDFGEWCYYSPRPLVVGEQIFTAYGLEGWGSDDLGRTWTELPGPPTPSDLPQRRLVFPLSDGGLLTVLEAIPDDDLSPTPPARVGRAGPGSWSMAPSFVSTGIESVTVGLPLAGGGVALVGALDHGSTHAEVEVVVRFDGEGAQPPITLPSGMKGLWREIIALQGGELVFLVPEHEPGKPAPTFSALVGATEAMPVALPSDAPPAQFATVALADGRLLLTGGLINGAPTAETWLLDPKTAAWTPGPPLPRPRAGHFAAQAPDGRVLLVGGVGVDWLGREAPLLEVDVLAM